MAIEDGFEVRAISGCCAWRLWRSKVAVSALEKANEEGREERKYGWDTGRRNTVTPAQMNSRAAIAAIERYV